MTKHLRCLILTFLVALLPGALCAKGADGIVGLKGTLQEASVRDDEVSFLFTGQFSLSFYTAAPDNPARRQIDLEFEVQKLPVRIPRWVAGKYDDDEDPFRVNFKNAGRHAELASHSGELVNVALFRPVLSYNSNGILTQVACTHAQVMPTSIVHRRGGHTQ